jgi:hypothetical protein
MNQETITNEAAALALDLDRAPSGEVIIERLLAALVLLTHENKELKGNQATLEAKYDKLADQMLLLTNLVDSNHAAILVLQGQRHQQQSGGIVN